MNPNNLKKNPTPRNWKTSKLQIWNKNMNFTRNWNKGFRISKRGDIIIYIKNNRNWWKIKIKKYIPGEKRVRGKRKIGRVRRRRWGRGKQRGVEQGPWRGKRISGRWPLNPRSISSTKVAVDEGNLINSKGRHWESPCLGSKGTGKNWWS